MRLAAKIAAILLGVVLLLGGAGLLILRTAWFREQLRQRVVSEIEGATGGRVEIAHVQFDAAKWRGRLEGLTIHGAEGPGREPLFRAEALEVDLNVVSFLKRHVDIAALRLLAPEIHVWVAPDGSTNLPSPKKKTAPGRLFSAELLDLAVGHFELGRGRLWWNDRRYDLELAVSDLRLETHLEQADRYAGRLEAGRAVLSSAAHLPPLERLAAQFQILRDRIEIGEFFLKTARSECRSSGVISNLWQPRGEFRYQAALDARELALAVPIPQLQAGQIQIQGTFDTGAAGWLARGKLSARQLAVSDRDFRVRDVFVDGEYSADPRQVRVQGLRVRLLGGQWNGRLTADYSARNRPVMMEGVVKGIRLEAVSEALATPARPLNRLGWAAAVNGRFNVQAALPVASRGLSLQTDLVLTPPETGGARTAVEGVVRASYEGRTSELQFDELRLSTTATSLAASGRMVGTKEENLQFHLQTTRFDDVTNAAAAFTGEKPEIPISLKGRAEIQGLLSGTVSEPSVSARLNVSRFAHEGREWDSLTGSVRWSPSRLRLVGGRLSKGSATVNVNLTAELQNGKFTSSTPFGAEVSVRDTQFRDLAVLAGFEVPLTGAVTGSLKLQGTASDPRGAGEVVLRRGALEGEPFDSLRTAVALEAGEVRLDNLRIERARSAVTGTAAFHPGHRTFRFHLRGENLALSDQHWLASTGRKLTGNSAFDMNGAGRLSPAGSALEKLSLDGNLQLQKVSLDGRQLGDLTAVARTEGDKLRVEIQSDFCGAPVAGNVEVLLRDRFPAQGRLEFRNLDIASLARSVAAREIQARSFADGTLTVTGEAQRLQTLAVTGTLTRLEVSQSTPAPLWTFRNAEPVNWHLADQRFTLDSFHLVGKGSDWRSSGSVELTPAGTVNLALRGTLNLAVLSGFKPNVEAGGLSTLDVRVTGTRSQPNLSGRLEIGDGSLRSEDLPLGLSHANGVLLFSGRRATIQKLTAEVGGGEVGLSGDVDFSGPLVAYRLRADAHRVRLRYPRGLSTLSDALLTFAGTNQRSLLSGELQITHAGTRQWVDLAAILAGLRLPPRTPSSSDWLQNLQLNVGILTAPDIRFETSIARNLQADANLRLRGTALNPALLGRVNITQGELEFQGTRYAINRGDVSFSNPFRIDPILNLDLQTRVSGYDITLTLTGSLQKLNVSYRSDPPLAFNELITLLAVGRAPTTDPIVASQQTAQARSLTELGASTIIGQAIAKPVSGRLQRFFGVSRLKFDPELLGPEGNPNARITIEQQVGKDITFTYIYNLASAQEQVIRMHWFLSGQWSLIAVRDANGAFGVDFLFRKRYR